MMGRDAPKRNPEADTPSSLPSVSPSEVPIFVRSSGPAKYFCWCQHLHIFAISQWVGGDRDSIDRLCVGVVMSKGGEYSGCGNGAVKLHDFS
jgi:hypothetical protein